MVVIAISTTASIMAVTGQFPGGTLRIATGELAAHNHSGAVASKALTGSLNGSGSFGHYNSASGIMSVNSSSTRLAAENGTSYTVYKNASINVTHSHEITINSTGNGTAHENRMPFAVVNRWKRTA